MAKDFLQQENVKNIQKHKRDFYIYVLGGLLFFSCTLVAIIGEIAGRPWVSYEEKVQEVIAQTEIPEEIILAYADCRDVVKLDCDKPTPVTSSLSIKVALAELKSIQGRWGGSNTIVMSDIPNIIIEPEREKDWNGSISGSASSSTANIIADISFGEISQDILHTNKDVNISMDVIVPVLAEGVNKFENSISTQGRKITVYIVSREEYNLLSSNLRRSDLGDIINKLGIIVFVLFGAILCISLATKEAKLIKKNA